MSAAFLPDAGLETEDGLATATILSDLSANIFSALLLVLILLLQLRLAAAQQPPTPRPVALERSGLARPHHALSRRDLVSLLEARAPRAAGLSLDLVDGGARTVDGTVLPPGDALEAIASRAATSSGSVRLYVFSNAAFAPVTAALRRAGREWDDVSVPRALRDRGDAERWSPSFLDLAAAATSDAAFREGLARLLVASPAPLVRDGHAAGAATSASGSAPAVPGGTPLSDLAHMVSVVFAGLALTAGAAVVLVVETRVGGTRSRHAARAGPVRLAEGRE